MLTKEILKEAIREVLHEFLEAPSLTYGESDLMDVKQAPVMLNLARATVYEKNILKILPHYKKGGKIMFKRSELIERMESGKVDTDIDRQDSVIKYLQSGEVKK